MKSDKIKLNKTSLIVVAVLLAIGAGFYLLQNYGWRITTDTSCVNIEEHTVQGSSLDPSIKEGTSVKGLEGYYECNEIEKGQIAIIKFLSREEAFIKRIVGLPGDALEFTEENQAKLNGEILKNSAGEPYLFSVRAQALITIPLKDGRIPEARYFILSEQKGPAAFDSRQFGFIQEDHLKGRVLK